MCTPLHPRSTSCGLQVGLPQYPPTHTCMGHQAGPPHRCIGHWIPASQGTASGKVLGHGSVQASRTRSQLPLASHLFQWERDCLEVTGRTWGTSCSDHSHCQGLSVGVRNAPPHKGVLLSPAFLYSSPEGLASSLSAWPGTGGQGTGLGWPRKAWPNGKRWRHARANRRA
jgi:hypothetical protein